MSKLGTNPTSKLSTNPTSKLGTDENPVDRSYYDLLEIPVNADEKQIKKQYRLMAMKYHPDKNSETGAEEKAPYQILSDPQLRAAYNKYGKDDKLSPTGGFADPQEFFQQMFGGDAFKSLIGELSIGRDLKEFSDQYDAETSEGSNSISPKMPSKEELLKRKQLQDERVRDLAEKLVHKLGLYTESEGDEGDEATAAAFESQIRIEAETLKEESFGVELLHAIGHTYSSKAKQFLGMKGGELPKIFQQIKEKRHIMKEFFGMVKASVDVQQTMLMLQKAEQKGIDAAENRKMEEEASNR
ncbi:X-domain of DnaJ-containing-domain-containing protein, partial [Jimgerdemannia flammicorona]